MQKGLIGKKIGMTQIFDDNGNVIPVTVVGASFWFSDTASSRSSIIESGAYM